MKRRLGVSMLGGVAVAAASTMLMAGPAMAVVPGSVGAKIPTYNAATKAMSASGTFVNNAASTATYTYTVQLIRTNGNVKPSCAAAGCTTVGTTKVVGAFSSNVSVASAATATVSVSATCAAGSITATSFYWTWVKVADTSGNVVMTSNGALSGKYC